MYALQLLHIRLAAACPNIHSKRLLALFDITQSLLLGQRLSLTQLGRSLISNTYVKHNIKRVDRLLGNENLYQERESIYAYIAQQLLKNVQQPVIIVDWSEQEQFGYCCSG